MEGNTLRCFFLTFFHTKNGDRMKINLGYVALPVTLEKDSSFKTLTFTRYKFLKEEANQRLDEVIRENLKRLLNILKYNLQNEIYFYRFSHNIVPLATLEEVDFDYITPYKKEWKQIGDFVKKHHMRIDTHPDQFCVLNSINPEVVKSSIRILEMQIKIFHAMGISGMSVIHIGGGKDNKEEALKRFKEGFEKLPEEVKRIIMIENDDRIFNAMDTLKLCEELNVPMVLDYHHHVCNRSKEKLNTYMDRILNTWKNHPYPAKIHLSSAKSSKEKRSHSDYIKLQDFMTLFEILKENLEDVDIMLECKKKDEALFRLVRQLRFYTDLTFLSNATIQIRK